MHFQATQKASNQLDQSKIQARVLNLFELTNHSLQNLESNTSLSSEFDE